MDPAAEAAGFGYFSFPARMVKFRIASFFFLHAKQLRNFVALLVFFGHILMGKGFQCSMRYLTEGDGVNFLALISCGHCKARRKEEVGHNGKTLLIQFLYTYFLTLLFRQKWYIVRLKSLPPRQAKTAKYLQPANSLPYPCEIRRAHTIIAPKSMKAKQVLFRGFRPRFRISSSSASKLCPFCDTHPTALGTGREKGV